MITCISTLTTFQAIIFHTTTTLEFACSNKFLNKKSFYFSKHELVLAILT